MEIDLVENKRKFKTLIFGNALTIFIQIFYMLRFNYTHHSSETNVVLFTLITLGALSFVFSFKGKYLVATLLILIPGSINLVLIIYQAGGINAPAPFWLFLLPLFYGVFFDMKGSIVGTFVSFIALFFFLVVDKYGLYYYQVEIADYKFDKIMNLYLFGTLLSGYLITYTKTYGQASVSLREANLRVDTLLRVVLHDLANQLTAINHRLKKLKRDDPYFVKLKKSSERSIEIIQSVRLLQKLDKPSFSKSVEVFPLKDLVASLHDEHELSLEEKSITLNIENELDEHKTIKTNFTVLKTQILGNVISNAIKFSYPDGVINFSIRMIESDIQFSIRDFGIGIPQEIQNNLFRLDATTSRKGTDGEFGTGYGMPIMKHFVNLLEGHVLVESSEEENLNGTLFTINLPHKI
ncbi:hypothetical protein A9Q84_11870 [Halobacteriovorax marinus]|uniref:histidine kinase n=1 Tax=Halobacteriovorax marinus TaxID=97084 RepID=A0A1Y5F815_9BACT|nr:hypothetical protein A9Q84_11870 [Halobacteriovorax marinus]